MTERFFAHTKPGAPEAEWEPLHQHLGKVADLAARFAASFDAEEWARVAGLWHDLGKFSEAFQDYLRQTASPDSHTADSVAKTDHSTAGAQHAVANIEVLGHLLAYTIAGHHTGLLDGRSDRACLEARLQKPVEPWSAAPLEILDQRVEHLPKFLREKLADKKTRAFSLAFFTRMVFSCLVDADFLATEEFMDPGRAAGRPVWPDDILGRMELALDAHLAHLAPESPGAVDMERARVRGACLAAAKHRPGFFSLTVPTGGGKTLSSLAFALRHTLRNGLGRIIYVLPFTTIIEQNAKVFREALLSLKTLGVDDPVLEHHSNFDAGKETVSSRLATENWDAPLVVTTSVQFYESLFGNRTSHCRKLHNLTKSVIILDEAQTIPVDYLEPCLRALRELVAHYGSTVVLCTATQPAVHWRKDFPVGLDGVREIFPEPQKLYAALRRVEVVDLGNVEDAELCKRLRQEERLLCIVNTRSHARRIFELLGETEGHFHLSALMCPCHRSVVLDRIKKRLKTPEVCRVVSTQLIEAGVDIDFPVVYRSLAGIDSIAQAAGRCNRNGTLPGLGRTYLFRSEHVRSERFFAETANCARQVLSLHDDPMSLEAIEHYFRLYYWDQQARWDAKGILGEFHVTQEQAFPFLFDFATVGKTFKLIDDSGQPVIIPWDDEARALCKDLRSPWGSPDRGLLRRLQAYTVQVPTRVWRDHVGRSLELVRERYAVLISPEMQYSEHLGLRLDEGVAGILFG